MGSKFKLTNRAIKDLKPAAQATLVHDTTVTGFCVVVTPAGSKSFYWYGRSQGRPRRIRIGSFPDMNTDDARKAARAIIGDVARGQPVGDRKRTSRRTVDDLFQHYMEVHAKPTKRTWRRDETEYKRLLQPTLGKIPLTAVRRDAVKTLLATIEQHDGKGPARKARSLLGKMYEIGIDSEWAQANPVRGTRRPEYDPRQRYIRTDEIAAFLQAVDQLKSGTARDFFLLSLHTGARRSNVASMAWTELDLTHGLWTIPVAKAKGKRPHTVPLSSHALAIIIARRGNGSPFVLPGRSRGGHYNDPKDAWRRILKLSGLSNLRIHDLRRSAGAWAQQQGASLRTIQQQMGHASPDVTAKVYTPVEHEQVRAASQAASDAMLEAATGGHT